VLAQHDGVVLERRRPAIHHLVEVDEVTLACGLQVDALADRDDADLGVDELLQRSLGTGLRQPGRLAGTALRSELALDLSPGDVEAPVVDLAAVLVGARLQRAGAVGAAR
jgi:hypothetical protein